MGLKELKQNLEGIKKAGGEAFAQARKVRKEFEAVNEVAERFVSTSVKASKIAPETQVRDSRFRPGRVRFPSGSPESDGSYSIPGGGTVTPYPGGGGAEISWGTAGRLGDKAFPVTIVDPSGNPVSSSGIVTTTQAQGEGVRTTSTQVEDGVRTTSDPIGEGVRTTSDSFPGAGQGQFYSTGRFGDRPVKIDGMVRVEAPRAPTVGDRRLEVALNSGFSRVENAIRT